jgi:hypothetical protein
MNGIIAHGYNSTTGGFYSNNKEVSTFSNNNSTNNYANGTLSVINGGLTNGNELIPSIENIENELILYDIENWTCGSQEIFIRLENEFGEEKASFRKTN